MTKTSVFLEIASKKETSPGPKIEGHTLPWAQNRHETPASSQASIPFRNSTKFWGPISEGIGSDNEPLTEIDFSSPCSGTTITISVTRKTFTFAYTCSLFRSNVNDSLF